MTTEKSPNSSLVNRQPTQAVMMVHPIADNSEHYISLVDICRVFKAKLKWFSLFVVICFIPTLFMVYQNGRTVNYKQLISIPTVTNQRSYQLENWLPTGQIINTFYAQYVQSWEVGHKKYVNGSFQLLDQLNEEEAGLKSESPVGLLWLTVRAPINAQQDIEKLFAETIGGLQYIVDSKMHVWKQGLMSQMAYQKSSLLSLNKLLTPSVRNKKNGDAAVNFYEEGQIRQQILQIKQALYHNKSLYASANPKVDMKGSLLVSKPQALLKVVFESALIGVFLAVIMMVLMIWAILNLSSVKKINE